MSPRSTHPLVVVLAALMALTAAAVVGSAVFVIAFGWRYGLAAIAPGALLLAGIAGMVVHRRAKSG